MKLTLAFLLITILQSTAGVLSQKISIDVSNHSVRDVLEVIEKQSKYRFFYNDQLSGLNNQVTFSAENQSVEDVLNLMLNKQQYSYTEMDNNMIVIAPREFIQAPSIVVTGTVTNAITGETLPGANVVVENTSIGVTTDIRGTFSITVPGPDAILVFTFVGYHQERVVVGNRTTINVVLREELTELGEFVVVGYGTQRKLDVTGSVATISGDDLVQAQSHNVINSLIGRLPGVIINNRVGEPGRDDPSIFVRGSSTTGNNAPLIIIDGVARDSWARMNPEDIESVTVLKDASAAIYGSRAANGVILVTTKQGKTGKPVFNFSYNHGLSQPTRNPVMADAFTFATVTNETEIARGRSPVYTDEELQKFKDGTDPNYPNTDWYDFIINDFTLQHQINLSASGGTDRVRYYMSLGERAQDGHFNFGTTRVQQYNLRSKVDATINDYLNLGLDIAGRINNNHHPFDGTFGVYSHIFLYHPTWAPYWPGTNYMTPLRNNESIINRISDNRGYRKEQVKGIETTLNYNVKIPWVNGLTLRGSANWDGGNNFIRAFQLPSYVHYMDNNTGELYEARSGLGKNKPALENIFFNDNTLTLNSQINFSRVLGNHNVGAMMGYEQMEYRFDRFQASRDDFPTAALSVLDGGSPDKLKHDNSGRASSFSRVNYYGRVTYDYSGKYLAQVIFRYDASPNFAKSSQWGFFPGVLLGWRMSEESFMQGISNTIDNLKIRVSYGEMGNDNVPAFQYLQSYRYGSNYVVGNNETIGIVAHGAPNPDITWEIATMQNIGFDASFWQGLLEIEFDVFKTERSNILTRRNVVVPQYTGLQLPDENIGIVENRGFEAVINHRNTIGDFSYSFTGNYSFARNKVIFTDEAPAAEPYQVATGRPIGSSLYYNAIGIFKDQDALSEYPAMAGSRPGDIMYEDVNGDGVINSLDRIRIDHSLIPEIVYGFSPSLGYKNIDFSALFQGQANAKFHLQNYLTHLTYSFGGFLESRAEGRWTPENTDATMPRPDIQRNNNNAVQSTFWLKSSSYLRLRNVELGYTLPSQINQRMGIQRLRIYVSGNNLAILFDHFKEYGFDPESNTGWVYPPQRVINFGVNLTF